MARLAGRLRQGTLRDELARVGLHVPNCELFAGMSKYKESGLVASLILTIQYQRRGTSDINRRQLRKPAL